jgi:hypothetical protein
MVSPFLYTFILEQILPNRIQRLGSVCIRHLGEAGSGITLWLWQKDSDTVALIHVFAGQLVIGLLDDFLCGVRRHA